MEKGSGRTGAGHRGLPRPATNMGDARILIAGAGIGGLTAALALARRGIPSHVLERRPYFAPEGAGIQIGPNGGHVLASLGLRDALRKFVGVPELIRVYAGRSGELLCRLPLGSHIEKRFGAPYWVAHRADLHSVLLEAVRSEKLITLTLGAGVMDVRPDPSGVRAVIADGRQLTGAGLIAADGLWSDLRSRLFNSSSKPIFSGRSAARAVLPAGAAPAGFKTGDVGVWLAPKAHVVHYPVRGGRELALVVVYESTKPNADWNAEVPADQVREAVHVFAPALQDLIAMVPEWRQWGLYDLPDRQKFVEGRVALLGDAAHPILPFLAQGGVMALEDGVTLAQCIARYGDVTRAFAAYQSARSKRVARVQKASRRNGQIYHFGGVAAALRDMALRAIPGSLLMARYDWLYGWRLEKQKIKVPSTPPEFYAEQDQHGEQLEPTQQHGER